MSSRKCDSETVRKVVGLGAWVASLWEEVLREYRPSVEASFLGPQPVWERKRTKSEDEQAVLSRAWAGPGVVV